MVYDLSRYRDKSIVYSKIKYPIDSSFTCGVKSIDSMINDSFPLCIIKRSYTYEVSIKQKIVAYYRVELRNFKNNVFESLFDEYSIGSYDDLFAIHIQYIAIKECYQKHGLGNIILDHIINVDVPCLVENCPFRLITLEGFKNLIPWYEKHNFKSLCQSLENPETYFMIQDLVTEDDLDALNTYNELYM